MSERAVTIHVRTRLLLVAAVAILGVAARFAVDTERSRLLERQAQVMG